MWGRKKCADNPSPVKAHGEKTLFNILGKDVCRNVIAPHLNAGDIEALMKTSWTMRELFRDSKTFEIQKDASEILRCAMINDHENFREYMLRAKKKYRHEFWRLLLVRTRGVEARGKRWEAISAIEFAVCAGSFSDNTEHNYLLNRMFYCFPMKSLGLVLEQITNLINNGTFQYGEWRGVLSAVADLDMRYTVYHDIYDYVGPRRAEKYWRENVVPYQERLPENVLQEICRQINWLPVPDFKVLPVPPKAVRMDGSEPFARLPLSIRKWGIFHGHHAGAQAAVNERGTGIGWLVPTCDRDVLRTYCKEKKEQLDVLLKEQFEMYAEVEAENRSASLQK